MKCPSCKSENVRRSRRRPSDGSLRSTFFRPYRCRACKQRFQKLANAPALATVAGISVFTVFALGLAIGRLVGESPADVEQPATTIASPDGAGGERSVDDASAPPAGNFELLAAAEDGDAKAQYQLGIAYFRGEGTAPEPALAYKWIEKSANQGYAEAQFALGHMHHGGRGALQSFPLAFKWYERAAEQEHAEAQYRLGLMYRVGQGAQMDKSKAFLWFTIAAAQGHDRARDARDNLQPALTPQQVQEIQREAEMWRPVVAKH